MRRSVTTFIFQTQSVSFCKCTKKSKILKSHLLFFLSYCYVEPTAAPTLDPTAPTSAPTNEVVDGYWDDDFVYADKTSVAASGTTEIYDMGWYAR